MLLCSDFIICNISVKLYSKKEGRVTAKSSAGIQNQGEPRELLGNVEI